MNKNGTVAILDVGSSKVVCLIAAVDQKNIKVLGIGHQLSEGIKAGIVVDVKKAENSILAAVSAAEKMADLTINEVFVNISGSTILSHFVSVETSISGQEVTDRDIKSILNEGKAQFDPEDTHILHCLPVDYIIDDTSGIVDPIGMCGNVLATHLQVITASLTAVRNMTNCLARCHLNVQDYVCSAYMSGIASLTHDEMQLGTTVIDIGAGNTSIAVFQNEKCLYVDNIALGGAHITRDIAKGLSTSIAYAERLKTIHGSVVTTDSHEHEMIDIQQSEVSDNASEFDVTGGNRNYISRALLTSIIKPRVEEILELVRRKIETEDLLPILGARVVITGGSSQIQGLRELANHVFGRHVRIAKPQNIPGMADLAQGPHFSTAIGTLLFAQQKQQFSETRPFTITKESTLKRFSKWFQQNF